MNSENDQTFSDAATGSDDAASKASSAETPAASVDTKESTGESSVEKTGEAAADMTGMKCMLRIAKKDPSFDYDRFFRAYAHGWLTKETLRSVDWLPADLEVVETILSRY